MRIVILHNAVSATAGLDDQETLWQAQEIARAITTLGYPVQTLSCHEDLAALSDELQSMQPDLVFNLVESFAGNSAAIHLPALLCEKLHIPYTGANAAAIALTTNKLLTKRWLKAGNLPTPNWYSYDECVQLTDLTTPYIVKSVTEDGSLGIEQTSIVACAQDLRRVLADRNQRFGGDWFAEHYIPGREFNISVLSHQQAVTVLPPAELIFNNLPHDVKPIVDYAAKWEDDSLMAQATARQFEFGAEDKPLLTQLKALSEACMRWFKVDGFARIDFRVDAQGAPYILEVNANPSLAPDAGFAAAALRAGMDYPQLIHHLLSIARSQHAV